MKCTEPITAWRVGRTPEGKYRLKFSAPRSGGEIMYLPCGRCNCCKASRAYEWSVRIMCEAQVHEENCAITLTYAPEHLPPKGWLCKEDFTKFMKRLRKAFPDKQISYYQCGEYGDKGGRPHHHACLFGINFSEDRYFWRNKDGHNYWKSDRLTKIWGKGNVDIGELTPATANYVAQYVSKKLYGDRFLLSFHYGEKPREYATMSRRPWIGKRWLEKYLSDVYPSDQIISVDGSVSKPPRAFDLFLEKVDKSLLDKLKLYRVYDEWGEVKIPPDENLKARRVVNDLKKNKRDGGI